MSILLRKDANVIVQGITGKNGTFHTIQSQNYGTNIVAGVTPGKGGMMHCDVPVYNSVAEACRHHRIDASVIFVPAPFAVDSIIEAALSGVDLVVCITEGIPTLDMVRAIQVMQTKGTKFIGPNCPGLIIPEFGCRLGIMPASIHTPGSIGIVSRSGTLTYEAVSQTTRNGLGQSACVGIGGDPVKGLDFVDVVSLFLEDEGTRGIVVIGEIGGNSEEKLASFLQTCSNKKPVAAYVAGQTAPPGKRMGHAGAIIEGSSGLAQAKIDALRDSGCFIADVPSRIGSAIEKALSGCI